MKSKTLLGMMACAAFVSAFADPINNNVATTNNWFTGAADGTALTVTAEGSAAWKTNATEITASVDGIDVAAGRISLSNDSSNPLKLVPAAQQNLNDGLVTITSVATLTPTDVGGLPSAGELTGAKAGFAVAVDGNVTNYYGYADGAWTKLTGANPPDSGDTTLKIVIDYRVPCAQFFVTQNAADVLLASNGTQVTKFALASGTTQLESIDCFGSGELASIDAKYEKAVAMVNDGKLYGTIAEAYNSPGAGGVSAVNSSGTRDESAAANGASKAVCMALNLSTTDADAVLTFVPASETADDIVLQTAIAPVNDVTVTFAVKKGDADASGSYPASAIPIPKEAGQYTIVPTVSAKSN